LNVATTFVAGATTVLHAADVLTGGHPWYVVAIVAGILAMWVIAMRARPRS
jgi:hypothetical protein